ncbi:carotenoid oxygenase family protein [Variovorax sp. J22R24]|uniref:carotenoid oxygenase family protein n=1 Tax=Variovorax gracilis TaxID=3053502 RepID=UPI002576206A|nr:carotenoid oxygenase family protein [Variovorax sp. J22R24]MDM0109732.1 carotenoid oxygenase family protein [Variovorax sp. J22R24]
MNTDVTPTPSERSPAESTFSTHATELAYLSGNFAPMTRETTAFDLQVRGHIPEDLDGRFLRIGPSPVGPLDPASYHWFTGTGLVHGLRLRGGRAEWYRSRFTLSADAATALGKAPISGPGDGQLPVNTNVTLIGGRVHAIVEAGALPIELDANLESVARSDFGGTLEGGFTAHPKRDPITGELVAITYEPGRASLRYVVVDAEGRAQTRAEIATPHEPMVHDVGFTRNFIVVLDLPVTFQPQLAPAHVFPYFWNERQAPRVGLLPRNGDIDRLIWFDAPSCYVFHIVNAYEAQSGEVIVDVVRHPRMFERDRQGPNEGTPVLARWTLDRASGRLSERVLDDHGGEFPRIDDRLGGQDYQFAYTAHWWGDRVSSGPVYKHDVRSGRTEVHDFGAGHASLEPVFVPRSGATDEDDGYVLAYVFNAERNASDVVVLSAQDFAGPPLAVVELPVRVPFGFHGEWVPDQP